MITKVRMPDMNVRILHEDNKPDMGGVTGLGFGGGCVVGEVSPFGRLVQWYPEGREQFPGAGTLQGSGGADGREC